MGQDTGVIDDLELAQRAALVGAEIGLRYFAHVRGLPQELKADGSVVTEADRTVEHEVRRVLLDARPEDAFLGEETGEHGRGRRRWILDGIDGTAVFVQGDRRWQTLIALEEDGRITVGVAVLPARGQMWWARRGAGAFVADFDGAVLGEARRLAVRDSREGLSGSGLGIVPPVESLPAARRDLIEGLASAARPREWEWAHAALLVAAGELDLAVQVGGKVWDYAPLSLIVEEAGGRFGGVGGEGHPVEGTALFSRSDDLHRAALALLL
ncbi:histidinol phosphate phosphatase [Streptosporangium sp. 'caverna']|nr:histidinol phosphate phosphatase [Streptosporangium sp. 'caverna']